MSHPINITESQFDQVALQGDSLVLVDFGATWCPPCRRLEPEIDAVAAEFGERLKVLKVDVDSEPGLAERFGVSGVPQMTFLKSGKVVDTIVGMTPRTVISQRIKALGA